MPAADTPNDFAALLAKARGGDNDALAALAQTYEPEVRIVARVLLGPALRPHLDTLDLVQSVHRSLLVGLRQARFDVSTPEQLVALALTLVRRKVARKWRKARRQQRLSRGGDDPSALAELLVSLGRTDADPARAAQINDAVRHVCAQLSAADRRLLELRLQGCSTAEAAREMGLDPDLLRVRLGRLRQGLRDTGVLTEWL
jgi:RNA polymerase sigma-70 factor (ECF subfamily)